MKFLSVTMPTPPSLRPRLTWVPNRASASPASHLSKNQMRDWPMFLRPEVRVTAFCASGRVSSWSESTPTNQLLPVSVQASAAPLPERPATPQMRSHLLSLIMESAISLAVAVST